MNEVRKIKIAMLTRTGKLPVESRSEILKIRKCLRKEFNDLKKNVFSVEVNHTDPKVRLVNSKSFQ